MSKIGFVSLDQNQKWLGGRYYLQNLIKCNSIINPDKKLNICDIWWQTYPQSDPFTEVRCLLGDPVVVSLPENTIERAKRKINRFLTKQKGAKDLFSKHGIELFFPIQPCDNTGISHLFWLPDFQHIRRPDLLEPELVEHFNKNYRHNVEKSSQIILSSQDAQNDFAEVYPDFLHKTHVLHFCSIPDDNWWALDPAETAKKYQLPERFFIACNQFTRHKNYITLFRALSLLSETSNQDVCLVCTGGTYDYRGENHLEYLQSYIVENNLQNRVRLLGLLPKAEQIALLRRSIAVLQASQFEGWSTVIEDAKTLGKLVLASNLPVNREQLGLTHPFYIEVEDSQQWATMMQKVWETTPAGPDLEQEQSGLNYLNSASIDCGLKFAHIANQALNKRS